MKIATAIFAIFFIYLTVIPCGDIKANDNCGDVVHLHQSTDQSQDHDGGDACSPFCSCQCCQTHIIPFDLSISNEFLAEPVLSFKYLTSNSTTTLFNFWHPPKTA